MKYLNPRTEKNQNDIILKNLVLARIWIKTEISYPVSLGIIFIDDGYRIQI